MPSGIIKYAMFHQQQALVNYHYNNKHSGAAANSGGRLFPQFQSSSNMRIRGEPQVFVSVAYDFEYLAEDGKRVFMKESEILLLINKTNHDWWQVRLA